MRRPPRVRGVRRIRVRRPLLRGGARVKGTVGTARSQLSRFRRATVLSIALTSLLLLLSGQDAGAEAVPEAEAAEHAQVERTTAPAAFATFAPAPADEEVVPEKVARAARDQARDTIRELRRSFWGAVPRLVVAAAALALAWIVLRILRPLVRHFGGRWERAAAVQATLSVVLWLLAAGLATSVLAGDVRALIGSVGLVGLALSWALQAPIESFTGWLVNAYRGYYRVGDRVAVGDVFGDVHRIDVLTTTLWEIGGPGRGAVAAEQPTGRLVTFPNNQLLSGSVVNLTRDFPWVWDEIQIQIGNESDVPYAVRVVGEVAKRVFEDRMRDAARHYAAILRDAKLELDVPEEPQVFASFDDPWTTNLDVRILVPARQRRVWKSELTVAMAEELAKPEHAGKIRVPTQHRTVQLEGPE